MFPYDDHGSAALEAKDAEIEALKTELAVAIQTRNLAQAASTRDLEAKRLAEAELNDAREAAAYAYQLAGLVGAGVHALDNLSAVSGGRKAPHEWPVAESAELERARRQIMALESRAVYAESQAKDFRFDADRLRRTELEQRKRAENAEAKLAQT